MGFVHHSNYLTYFELARIEWLNSIDFSYTSLEKDEVIMPVIKAEIFFMSPAFFDDLLSVELSLLEMPKVKVKFKYIITNNSGKEIATGSTTLAFLNSQNNRPIRCPKSLIKKLQTLVISNKTSF
jgi:acyl-CoA thioester hydrolase